MDSPLDSLIREARTGPPEAGPGLLAQISHLIKGALSTPTRVSSDTLSKAADLAESPQSGSPETRLSILLDVAQLLYTLDKPFLALRPAKFAVSLAEAAKLPSLRRRALNFYGVVSADTGDVAQAIESYAAALEVAEEIGDLGGKCSAFINLGVALLNCAQYLDAMNCLERACDLAGDRPELKPLRLSALSNIALCCLHLEDFSKGLKAAEKAIKESPDPQNRADHLNRVLRENNYIRLLLEINDTERALTRVEIAKKYASVSGSARAEIAAAIAEGLCEVHAGRADLGISRLTTALEKARGLRSMLRDALSALVKSYEMTGQPERALMYLREMMETGFRAKQEDALRHLHLLLSENASIPVEANTGLEKQLARREAALKGQVAEQELYRSRIEMLERLAVTAELRDDSTGEHSYRVGKLSGLLASEFGCDQMTCHMIELAARLHDIGKIGVPDAILLKPGKLNDSERSLMKAHTTVGAELLSKSNIPHLQMAEDIARHHHEWWNGEGYPGSLAGSSIPLAARVTALADVFDALTHKRPYKEPWPIEKAIDEIVSLQGKQFDPELAALFVALITRLKAQHKDLDIYLGEAARSSPFLVARSKIWETLGKPNDPTTIATTAEPPTN